MDSRIDIKLVTSDTQTILIADKANLEQDETVYSLIASYTTYDETRTLTARMVKDFQRSIIVLSGDKKERDRFATKIANIYLGFLKIKPEQLPQERVVQDKIPETKYLAQPTEDTSPVPSAEQIGGMKNYAELYQQNDIMTGGPYKGMSAAAALTLDKDKALSLLFGYAYRLPNGPEKANISLCCKQFMRDLSFIKNDYETREQKLRFLRSASSIMKIELFLNGYSDLAAFAQSAQDSEITLVFEAVIKTLEERGTRSTSAIR